jgi:endothelin-converting enzyme
VHASSEILYNLSPKYQELDACTDFEQLVCEGWSERHDLRPDQGATGTLSTMSETSQTLLRHILEAPYPDSSKHSSFSPAQLAITESSIDKENFEKLKTAYNACMDEDTIKKAGATPLLDVFEQILKLTELSDMVTYLAEQGISAFISAGAVSALPLFPPLHG